MMMIQWKDILNMSFWGSSLSTIPSVQIGIKMLVFEGKDEQENPGKNQRAGCTIKTTQHPWIKGWRSAVKVERNHQLFGSTNDKFQKQRVKAHLMFCGEMGCKRLRIDFSRLPPATYYKEVWYHPCSVLLHFFLVKGNEMANLGNYQAAVDLFTEAINLDAKDFRFVCTIL